MKQISGTDMGELRTLQAQIDELNEGIKKNITQYNKVAAPLYNTFDQQILDMNNKIGEYNNKLGEIVTDARTHYNDQSRDWQRGPEGKKYMEWIRAIENSMLSEAETVADWQDIDPEEHTLELPEEDVPVRPS